MKKVKIKFPRGWIAYPGSTIQQNYAEDQVHGYLQWDIESRDKFDVSFHALSNPKPYVTIPWKGSVFSTVEHAKTFPVGSRFRIYNKTVLPQKDVVDLNKSLRESCSATEVTYKTDENVSRDLIISSGATQVAKEDLRNADVLLRLIKEYHHDLDVPESIWSDVKSTITSYLSQLAGDDIVRNTKWSLRQIKFDNTLAYGEGNVLNFDSLSGIVGIFGPNRSGKSSIVGTLMYALFNGTDRGSIKNLHVVNTRKPYCLTRSVIAVNGTDYVIERQTIKNENKRGQINASTSLNVFRIDDGEAIDLAGEQRTDTEKVIKRLIGTADDFLLTSLSAQDEIKAFISHGSTRRRMIMSRFLDLDIFDKMHDFAKADLNSTKAIVRSLPERDWETLNVQINEQLAKHHDVIEEHNVKLRDCHDQLSLLNRQLSDHKDTTPITKSFVDNLRLKKKFLLEKHSSAYNELSDVRLEIDRLLEKIEKIELIKSEYDVADLKKQLNVLRVHESNVLSLKHKHERESQRLKQTQRSLKILDEVPCGDHFPTCKFIKDAYELKDDLAPQELSVKEALEKLTELEVVLSTLKKENVQDKLEKLELLDGQYSKLNITLSSKRVELLRLESDVLTLDGSLSDVTSALVEAERALENEENAEITSLKAKIDKLHSTISSLDSERIMRATEKGRLQSQLDKHNSERAKREEVLLKMRANELIASAFSKKGIPNIITKSQLPLINAEIAKILNGIVDFTVEMENDDESDASEVYINYGDSRRLVELGSGMEKMVSSVAIRVALTNISSLPKTDIFVIDEGFGALDDLGVEACNRLLSSLKRYFKTIIVITHVEGVKDAADMVLEVTKNEKDSKIVYE